MSSDQHPNSQASLDHLLTLALQSGNFEPLEADLIARDAADPRQRTELVNTFAARIATLVTTKDPPVEQLETLLDGWAAKSPLDQEHEILPILAVASYGRVALARPDWWSDEIRKLHTAASHPHPAVRETVVSALRQLIQDDPNQQTAQTLKTWRLENNSLLNEVTQQSLNAE